MPGLLDYFGFSGNGSSDAPASPGPIGSGGIAYPTRKNYVPSPEVKGGLWNAGQGSDSPGGWQTTVTPASDGSSQTPQGGGLWASLGNSLNTALANPLFQFGIGMAGAGSEGKGMGGGLWAGAENAPNAMKILQAQRQQKFANDLNDPTSAAYKAMSGSLSPAAMAAIQGDPTLVQTLLAHKGDLESAQAIAQINADAGVRAKIAEMRAQRDMNMDMMRRFGAVPGAPGGTVAQPPMTGARQAKDGNWYVPDPNRPGKYMMVQP